MKLNRIEKKLKEVHLNYNLRNSKRILKDLDILKTQAVRYKNQELAKKVWCLETILKVQDFYIEAYNSFKFKNFYEGWQFLERFEIEYVPLFRHFQDKNNEYWLDFMYRYVTQYQSIFPYKTFGSPEYVKKEVKCSICDQVISLRNPCDHRRGEIYNGELCTRLITKGKLISSAMVNSPAQKYSVFFEQDPKTGKQIDTYNYSVIDFVIDRLKSPFDKWTVCKTEIKHPHSKYKHVGHDGECPCGSGKIYNDCCLTKSGVLGPHWEIAFDDPVEGLTMYQDI